MSRLLVSMTLVMVAYPLSRPLFAQPADNPTRFTVDIPAPVPIPAPAAGEEPAPPPAPTRPKDPQTQIETDLKGFVKELNDTQSYGSIYAFGGRFGFFGADEWFQEQKRTSGTSKLELVGVAIEKIEGDNATVKISLRWRSEQRVGEPRMETVQLQRQNFGARDWANVGRDGIWGIVSGPDTPIWHSLSSFAFFLAQKPGTLPIVRRTYAMGRLKELGLGTMQFLQDWDEIYRFDNEHLREAITPYIKQTKPFEIPGTHEDWTFNENLSDKSMQLVKEPAQTVLFYDGSMQKLNFRWDESPVCFCDGHVELVSPEKATQLRWMP